MSAKCLPLAILAILAALPGCAGCPLTPGELERQTHALQRELDALLPSPHPDSLRAALELSLLSNRLAQDWRVVWPAQWHNGLVHMGLRERGLCCHWARNLVDHARGLNLEAFDVHWAVHAHETWFEHNSLVLAPAGQPLSQGLVLDPWRESGRLVWRRARNDVYVWREQPIESRGGRVVCAHDLPEPASDPDN